VSQVVTITGVELGLVQATVFEDGQARLHLVPSYRFRGHFDNGTPWETSVIALHPDAIAPPPNIPIADDLRKSGAAANTGQAVLPTPPPPRPSATRPRPGNPGRDGPEPPQRRDIAGGAEPANPEPPERYRRGRSPEPPDRNSAGGRGRHVPAPPVYRRSRRGA
jgi:hypothetical protein